MIWEQRIQCSPSYRPASLQESLAARGLDGLPICMHRSRIRYRIGHVTHTMSVRERDPVDGHARIYKDYFCKKPVYNDRLFRRRFRMRRRLFLKIVAGVLEQDDYFQQKVDALGNPGLSPLQKVVAAIRILSYGVTADYVDEYVRIGESSANECLEHFCSAVIAKYGGKYLRTPTQEDVQRLMKENCRRGFPGMIGSLDCYH